jgi:hypothetical protein
MVTVQECRYWKIIFEHTEMLRRFLREMVRFKRFIFMELSINDAAICPEIAAIGTRSSYCRVDL